MNKRSFFNAVLAFVIVVAAGGCAFSYQHPGPRTAAPRIEENSFTPGDGKRLALSQWAPSGEPWAILIALHGFNGYRKIFEKPAEFFSDNGVLVLAYDQRGFGEDPEAGHWAGADALARDLDAFLTLVKAAHPGVPVFVAGESMGAAVILKTLSGPPRADGLILLGPAVWGWSEMNPFYEAVLKLATRLIPWAKFSGRRFGRLPSDNIAMLQELAADPLVIKGTRLDAITGLVNLMQDGLDSAPGIRTLTLVLYGAKDRVVPHHALSGLKGGLPPGAWREKRYPNGYHMLLRDCSGDEVAADVLGFMAGRAGKTLERVMPPKEPACPQEGP
jgi:alpha-beta hydrolase superfamily lysophospholipase